MGDPASREEGIAFQRVVVGLLSAVICIAAAAAGRPFVAAAGAAGLWFGTRWIIRGVIAQKHAAISKDEAAAKVPLTDDLRQILDRLEAARSSMAAVIARRIRTRLPLGLAAGVLIWAKMQFDADPPGLPMLAVFAAMGAAGGWAWASATLAAAYRRRYKADVLPCLAATLGELTYRPAGPPNAEILRKNRLFSSFDRIDADDEITGTYHGVPIRITELKLTERRGDDDREVFDGLFIRIALPRTLAGVTAVTNDQGMIGAMRAQGGARVRLEDPEFERVYDVHATNQVSARALLTPGFMQRFLALGERTGFQRPLALAHDNDLTVTLPKQGYYDLFEPPDYTRPADSRAALTQLRDDLAAVLSVADAVIDLDQSVRGRGA